MKPIIPSLLLTCLLGSLVLGVRTGSAQAGAGTPAPSIGAPAEIALIRKMEEDRVQAGVLKNVEAIAAATADEYLQIDFNGTIRDKSTAMQRIKSSAFQLQSNSLDDMVVRIFGDTAVVTARSTPKGTLNGRDFGQPLRYSRVYVKRDGRWQVVMFQMTHVAEDK
jgi:ketosteroid isomerase-like protein